MKLFVQLLCLGKIQKCIILDLREIIIKSIVKLKSVFKLKIGILEEKLTPGIIPINNRLMVMDMNMSD